MHRSRIGVVLIDVDEQAYDAAAAFWAGASGDPVRQGSPPDDEYAEMSVLSEVHLSLQRTGAGTPPRVHIDIEADDVEAETARLVGLGATISDHRGEYVILADPAGQPVCVVPVQTGAAFEEHARSWD